MNKTALSNAPWVVPGVHRHKTKPNFQLHIQMCEVATKNESKEDFYDSSISNHQISTDKKRFYEF